MSRATHYRARSHECSRCAYRASGDAEVPIRCPSCGRLGSFFATPHEAHARIQPASAWVPDQSAGMPIGGDGTQPDYGFGSGMMQHGPGMMSREVEVETRGRRTQPDVQLQIRDIDDVEPTEAVHLPSGLDLIDTITCGGPCVGSVSGLTSFPGVGKSTLLLEMAYRYRAAGRRVTILALEEPSGDIARRARRLDLPERFAAGARRGRKSNGWVKIISPLDGPEGEPRAAREARMANGFSLLLLLEQIDTRTEVCILDSVSRCHDPGVGEKQGTPRQLKHAGHAFYERCHATGRFGGKSPLVGFAVLQSTKAGDSAVPQAFTHTVDATYIGEHVTRDGPRVVACQDQKRPTGFVCFRSHGKNRDGSVTAFVYARMTAKGLIACEEDEIVALPEELVEAADARGAAKRKREGELQLAGSP